MKFYEYLCAGKPVVAVPAGARALQRYFYPAATGVDFVPQIESAVDERTRPERVRDRIAFATRNSWGRRRQAQLATAVARPLRRVAVVIVSYNNLDYLRLCLESLWARTLSSGARGDRGRQRLRGRASGRTWKPRPRRSRGSGSS